MVQTYARSGKVGGVRRYTPNYGFAIPNFDAPGWGNYLGDDLDVIDAVLFGIYGFGNVVGAWENNRGYVEGQRVVDSADGTVWEVLVAHTSAASGTFAEDRTANPTYWVQRLTTPINDGVWQTDTVYNVNTFLQDENRFGVTTRLYTSGATYDDDVSNGDIITLVDLSSFSLPAVSAGEAYKGMFVNPAGDDFTLETPDEYITPNLALANTVDKSLREIINGDLACVFDWMTSAEQADVIAGTLTLDVTTAVQNAVASGASLYFPRGAYKISDTIKVITPGQTLQGAGKYTGGTRLVWYGTSGNILEFNSRRRDQANAAFALSGARVSGFYIYGATNSRAENFIWIEDGTFHSILEDVYMRVVDGRPPTNAFVQFCSGSTGAAGEGNSYSVGFLMRDVVMRGDISTNGGADGPVPIGVHVQSTIESRFDNVKVYDVELGWVFGDADGNKIDNVQGVTMTHCMAEVGDRDYATASAACMVFYYANSITLDSCILNSGAGATSGYGNNRCVKFKTKNYQPMDGIRFLNCQIWGFGQADYLIEVEQFSEVIAIFHNNKMLAANLGVMTVSATAYPWIDFGDPDTNFYNRIRVRPTIFRTRSFRFGTNTINAGTQVIFSSDVMSKRRPSEPTIGSASSVGAQPVLAQAYGAGGVNGDIRWAVLNAGASNAVLGSTWALRMRELVHHEIKARKSIIVTPGTINNGSRYAVVIPFKGAVVGDFVIQAFYGGDLNGMNGMFIGGYVSAADNVVATIANFTGGSKALSEGYLETYIVNENMFDILVETTIDMDVVPANSWGRVSVGSVVQTITVTGAVPGDAALVALSINQSGLFFFPVVISNNNVQIVVFNSTDSGVNLGSGTFKIGVFDTHTVR